MKNKLSPRLPSRPTGLLLNNNVDMTKRDILSIVKFYALTFYQYFFVTNDINFAVLDCNQVLPSSNKTIYDRFKLKKEYRPVFFVTAPWLLKPVQAEPTQMKDVQTFKKFVENTVLFPKGNILALCFTTIIVVIFMPLLLFF
jgi:hypothetical protein